MQEWTPWQAWWLDLLKFAITFALGAIITLLFVDRMTWSLLSPAMVSNVCRRA